MTPATEAKAGAISVALHKRIDRMPTIALLVAMLTSANKDEREGAKREVRELVKQGITILQADQEAANLADFANRHEP